MKGKNSAGKQKVLSLFYMCKQREQYRRIDSKVKKQHKKIVSQLTTRTRRRNNISLILIWRYREKVIRFKTSRDSYEIQLASKYSVAPERGRLLRQH
jgi:hypothetical protein